ncbi:phage tail assembly chaperone [Desulfovibrio sp.]|nr:phage tail assembly chaperone [Desulfovibrio sp.]
MTAQLAAWDAYAEALCELPAQEGAPFDGGGELTPWPDAPAVAKAQEA